jgi:hypothetical protein
MADQNKVGSFRDQYTPAAQQAGAALGVSPDVLLSQWALETGWGKSIIPGTNNLGNIKDFSGAGTAAVDNMTKTTDKYRSYASPEAFAQDYVDLIKRKYPSAVGAGNDPVAYASALHAGGYAEDPNYVNSVAKVYSGLTNTPFSPSPIQATVPVQVAQTVPHASDATRVASAGQLPGTVPTASPATADASWRQFPDSVLGDQQVKQAEPKYTTYEKLAVQQEQGFAARAGYNVDQLEQVAKESRANAGPLAQQIILAGADRTNLDTSPAEPIARLAATSDRIVQDKANLDAVTLTDKATAAIRRSGTMQAISDIYNKQNMPPEPQFNQDFMANWQQKLAGYDYNEQERLLGSRSEQEFTYNENIIRRERNDDRTLRGGSQVASVGLNLLAGLTDVPSMVAFMGVGKVAQLGGVGAFQLAKAGRPVAALLSSGVEGAVGGMLLDGTLAAAGQHYTMNDVVASTGINFGMGLGFGLLHLRGASMKEASNILADSAAANADREKALWAQAQDNLGAGATPEQLAKEVDTIQVGEAKQVYDAAMSEASPERSFGSAEQQDMFSMNADMEHLQDEFSMDIPLQRPGRPLPEPRMLTPEETARAKAEQNQPGLNILLADVPENRKMMNTNGPTPRSPEVVAALEARYGVEGIADPGERALAVMYYEGAERILKNNQIDLSRVSKLTKAVGMESTSQTMLSSKNPLLQAFGAVITESGAGIAGRGQTASLSRHMNYKNFMSDFNTVYDNAYYLWSRENGGSTWGDHTNGKHRERFNRLVAETIEHQLQAKGPLPEMHPALAAAVRAQREGMDRMRVAMQKVGTVGSARLGDNSVAYMTRTMSAERVRNLSNAEKKGVTNILKQQFMELNGYDEAFAAEHAKRYLDIANQRALGNTEMPLSIHDERAADVVMDSLRAMNVPEEEIRTMLGRFSRGGANFTKGRADLNLNTRYDIDGHSFSLMDLVDTDVPRLYRAYAQRAAGEVALTQHGIQGRNGLSAMRVALAHGPDGMKVTEAEMAAFDQVSAEMMGTPFGNRVKAIDNATTLASILRLGGMGITQAGESLNGLSVLGVGRVLQSIAGMPRLIREAGMQAKGGKPKNPIIGSIEVVGGELGMEHYRTAIPFAQNDIISKNLGLETMTTMDRIIKSGSHVQAKLSFHQAIMTGQIRGMSEQIVHKAVRFIRTGAEDAALADMGFSPATLKALKKDLPAMAKFEGDKLVDFDITKATDKTAAAEFVTAVNRGASQIIQGTYIGETGKWAHSSWVKMLTQFRTFGLISVEKQWNRQAGVHGAAKALGYILAATSVAIPMQVARVYAASVGMSRADADKYREKNLSPFALVKSSMNYISALGMAPDFFDALSIPLGLEPSDARGLSTGLGRVVPVAGAVEDVMKAGKAVSTWSPLSSRPAASPADAFKNLVPFGRLPYVIPLVNALTNK